jgi:cytochrome c oxidase assembly factor CtaG
MIAVENTINNKLVKGKIEIITFSSPYIITIVAIIINKLISIVKAKAPKEINSEATCYLKSLIE